MITEIFRASVRSYKDLVETTVGLIRSRRAAESRSAEQPARFVARIVPSEGRSGGILERVLVLVALAAGATAAGQPSGV